jgi:GT2 family glycosyltransferase
VTPEKFFEQAECGFREAELTGDPHNRDFGIFGLRIRVCFAGPELVLPLTRALDHLRLAGADSQRAASPDLTILAWAGTQAGQLPPSPGLDSLETGSNGSLTALSNSRFTTSWMFAAAGLQMLDRDTSRALYWVRDETTIPYWETGAPMRFLLDSWFASKGLLLLHAAALADRRGAVLLVGSGGSGKSSTALSCLQSNLNYLSDDYVLLNPNDWTVHSIYNSGKVDLQGMQRLAFLKHRITNNPEVTKEKGLLFVHETFPHKMLKGPLPVQAIACPVLGKPLTQSCSIPPATALKALAVSTILQSSKPSASTLAVLAQLVRQCPTFELQLAPDSSSAAAALDAMLPKDGTSERPLVSVIIPAYNPGPFLRDALASILAQDVSREGTALEVIIIDDGSDEDIAAWIKEFSSQMDIRLHRQSQQGPSAARNHGITIARGEWLSFLDADDLWPAGSLEARMRILERSPSVEMVHGQLRNLVESTGDGNHQTFFGPPRRSFNVGSMLFRRGVFERTGQLDEKMRFSEDVDLLVRTVETGIQRSQIETVCLYYRRHGGGLTGPMKAGERGSTHLKSWAHILKHSLDRRRA